MTGRQIFVALLYLLATCLFIFGLKGMTRVRTARRGNGIGALGMLIAVIATLIALGDIDYRWIAGGLVAGTVLGTAVALRVPMTAMPEMVALLNGCGGGASALVALAIVWVDVIEPAAVGTLGALMGESVAITTALSVLIGGVTLSGSLVAFLKLRETISGQPLLLPGRHVLNAALLLGALGLGVWCSFSAATPAAIATALVVLTGLSLALGALLVLPIGGADMPVVISLLNSYSGLAAGATGFVLSNNLLIISGALVGASGIILSKIMCVAMNRTLTNVLFGGFGTQVATAGSGEYTRVRSYGAEDAALVLEAAESVIVVPGYGLAVAQAQHIVRELANRLEQRGVKLRYAIHPVAGRMPGHMNVLLAEADVPYEQLWEMERINPDFKNTDVVLVVGANDVVNPAAQTTPGSPIYGMPILEVFNAGTVIVIKRSLSPGFAGIKNDLFEYDNTMMIFGDAKEVLQSLLAEVKAAAA